MNDEIIRIKENIINAVTAEKIYLFGSYAYGTPNKDSDYDIYIVLPDGGMRPIEAAQKARRSLPKADRKTAVDIIADYYSRFNDRKRFNTLERKVEREGVLLYERV